ncbi:MAG: hypothetical protein K8U57_15470 [Planctomycetes bacterium]|nr:hypothetical protein [Planctomycetota bacterium]
MRALVHIKLAALLVLAPALCCCNLHYLTGRAAASDSSFPMCPSCSPSSTATPEPPACCQHQATPAKNACCAEPTVPDSKPDPKPQPQCKCACERSDAAPPQTAPEVATPEFTGELLPVLFLLQTAVPLEHLGLLGGLDPPERAGVDTRSEALFSRHVMRG